jgi:alpha-1,3-mannosyltransferase
VRHLARCLQADGHCIQVVTLNRLFDQRSDALPAEEILDGLRVTRLSCWGPRQYAMAPGVLRYARRCDLIHVHSSDFFLDYLTWTQPLHQRPLVLSSHGVFFHTPYAHVLKRVYFQTATRFNLRRIAAVLCHSRSDQELLRTITPAHKLHHIPNGIDERYFAAPPGVERDPNLLVCVGRLAPNKQHDRLLRAFALVAQQHPAARLALVGPGWNLLPDLQRLSAQLGIEYRVDFRGYIADEELRYTLSRASVWLSASSFEGFGIALLEAMAAGCIPVVHPLPSFQEFMTEGKEGFFVDFTRPQQAADVILQALALPQIKRAMMAAQAQATAQHFTWPNIARQVEEVYQQAVASTH